jgi:hypothetical protein
MSAVTRRQPGSSALVAGRLWSPGRGGVRRVTVWAPAFEPGR